MRIRPFRGIRPRSDVAAQVASRPYDVLTSAEAREEARDNPLSFLYVVKPEISLGEKFSEFSEKVYTQGKENFRSLCDKDLFFQDAKPCLYIYQLISGQRSQVGVVACASVEDYMEGKLKKHELTRPDKEKDRTMHVKISMMNAEPVFFAYPSEPQLDELAAGIMEGQAEYDFQADDNVRHRFWVVDDDSEITKIVKIFSDFTATYVADGHHRTAAAALAGKQLQEENPDHTGDEEYNFFLAVHFPDNQLSIMDYNRVVRDLNGHDPGTLLELLVNAFEVEELDGRSSGPEALHTIDMYLGGSWYRLRAREEFYDDDDPLASLDVTILSENILTPLLGIHDLRNRQTN